MKVSVDLQKCLKCGLCEKVCKHGIFRFRTPGGHPEIGLEAAEGCSKCGHCTAVCPADAVAYEGFNPLECVDITRRPAVGHEELDLLLRSRRSCRNFTDEPVHAETVSRIARAARYSPTAKNSRGVKIAAVMGRLKVRELAGLTFEFYKGLADMATNPLKGLLLAVAVGRGNASTIKGAAPMILEGYEKWKAGTDLLFYDAPAIVAVYADGGLAMPKDDCDYALFSMALFAESLGLGTCINGFLTKAAENSKKIRDFFGLKGGERFFGAMALGHPSVRFRKTVSREPLETKFIR